MKIGNMIKFSRWEIWVVETITNLSMYYWSSNEKINQQEVVYWIKSSGMNNHVLCHVIKSVTELRHHIRLLLRRLGGAFDLRLAVSVPLPIVMGIFVLLWFQSRLT